MVAESALQGKVAIITGGAQGIGKEIARQFAKVGCNICIGDLNYDLAVETGREIEALGVKCLVVDVDTSVYLQVEQMVNKTLKELGRLDILVNNAAFVVKSPFLEYTEELWNKITGVCLNGYFFSGQLAAKAMVENGTKKGKIINMSSVAGFMPHSGLMAYSTAKAGVLAMTKIMSHELRKHDISVNAIVPAITDTPLMAGLIAKVGAGNVPKMPMMPKGAISTSEDVAKVVLTVASDTDNLLVGNAINVGSAALG